MKYIFKNLGAAADLLKPLGNVLDFLAGKWDDIVGFVKGAIAKIDPSLAGKVSGALGSISAVFNKALGKADDVGQIVAKNGDELLDDVVDLGNPWSKTPLQRGNIIDEGLGNNVGHNFHTIDKFDDGIATSVKSYDTATAKTLQNGSDFERRLKKDIDSLSGFNGNTWGGVSIDSADISRRQLQIALPDIPLNSSQADALNNARRYAEGLGVDIKITIIR